MVIYVALSSSLDQPIVQSGCFVFCGGGDGRTNKEKQLLLQSLNNLVTLAPFLSKIFYPISFIVYLFQAASAIEFAYQPK